MFALCDSELNKTKAMTKASRNVGLCYFTTQLLLMSNPWKILEPFEAMFDENITIVGQRKNGVFSEDATACVYPSENVETFSDADNESKIKRRKILVLKSSIDGVPQTGDRIELEDNSIWKVDDVNFVQDWYDLEVRN